MKNLQRGDEKLESNKLRYRRQSWQFRWRDRRLVTAINGTVMFTLATWTPPAGIVNSQRRLCLFTAWVMRQLCVGCTQLTARPTATRRLQVSQKSTDEPSQSSNRFSICRIQLDRPTRYQSASRLVRLRPEVHALYWIGRHNYPTCVHDNNAATGLLLV